MPFDEVEADELRDAALRRGAARRQREAPGRPSRQAGTGSAPGARRGRPPPRTGRGAADLYALLPGVLIVVLSFRSGGISAATTALAALALAALLAIRVPWSRRPFAGLGPAYLATAALLALLALWTLASGAWSHAPARAFVEFDRALLYTLAFVLLGACGRTPRRIRWMVRAIAAGASLVCLCALITRLLPDVWELPAAVANERLSYPMKYWNALGLLAALALVLNLALTADEREHRAGRVLAAAALPALAATVLLTFSRSALAVALVGCVALVVVGRPRALPTALLVAVPTMAIATLAAYRASLLASDEPTTAAAAAQGHDVALVVALCTLVAALGRNALLRLDGRMPRLLPEAPIIRRRWIAAAAGLAAGFVIGSGLLSNLDRQYERFVVGDPEGEVAADDNRARLATPRNNGRLLYWRVALDGFSERPLGGEGAGTYQLRWDRFGRASQFDDAHSLYIEMLGELGLVGLALVLAVVLSILGGFLARARGPDRVMGGALFGAGLAWALHAAVDWDWETPAVTLWFFAAGGLALAAPPTKRGDARRPPAVMGPAARGAIVAVCLALSIVPARVLLSDGPLRSSARALAAGDCAAATREAQDARAVLGVRPEPHVITGYCAVRRGMAQRAVDAMQQAVRHDPQNWEVHYGLSVARAAAGLDPRPAARTAARLRPRDALPPRALRLFDTWDPRRWRERAAAAPVP